MSDHPPAGVPSQWQRVKDLYFEAIGLSLEARTAFLDAQCPPGDPAREELRRLLDTNTPSEFLGSPPIALRPLAPGRLLGPYRIQAELGAGGAGVVYRAEDTRLHRTVALKVLRQALAGDPQSESRFTREAELASSLNHPNIVTVHEIGSEGATNYIVMEHVAGRTLADTIRSGLTIPKALALASQIASALAAAHENGITHRDLKPGNIMVTADGRIKVLDFGLARRTLPPAGEASVTTPGTVVGTFAYMSPEQVRGEPVDPRSDVFSFGGVLYQMLSGKAPFVESSSIAIAAAVLYSLPAPLPAVPPEIARLVFSCLEKDRSQRWQSMLDARIVIDQALDGLSHPSAATPVPPPSRWRKAAPPIAAFAAGAALFVAPLWRPVPQPSAALNGTDTILTADAGLSAYPALSQDGSLVAYASDRSGGGNLDIWVQQVRGGEPIRLTHEEADDSDPDISPDRTRIAFRSERAGGGVYVVPALGGGTATLLVPGCRNPRFSPDGNSIACWTGREGTGGYEPGSAKVFVVPAGGGELKQIHPEFGAALYPVWSPKGNGLLVLGRPDKKAPYDDAVDWWLLPLADSSPPRQTGALKKFKERRLRAPIGQMHIAPASWVADPSRALFSAATGDSANVWQVPLDTETGAVQAQPSRLTAGTGLDLHAATASGRLVYSSLSLNIDIWALPIDAERGTPAGALYPLTRQTSVEDYPSISFDGKRLAYVRRQSDTWFLRIRDLPDGAERTLVSANSTLMVSHISGDGSRLVYSDFADSIYTIGAAGGTVDRLCQSCGIATGIAPDGGYALIEPLEPPEHVVLVDTQTKKTRNAIQTGGGPGSLLSAAKPSPDGSWIAFLGETGAVGRSRLFVAPFDPQRPVGSAAWIPVTEEKTEDHSPAWSPKANLLYFLSDRDGFRCIWAQALDSRRRTSGPPFSVHHFHHANLSLRRIGDRTEIIGLSVAPRMLVFATGELSGNIWSRQF